MSRHTHHLSKDPVRQQAYHQIPKRKAWKMRQRADIMEAWTQPSIWIIHRNRGRITIKIRHVDQKTREEMAGDFVEIGKKYRVYVVDEERGILYKPKEVRAHA